jgi:hypothetical protein
MLIQLSECGNKVLRVTGKGVCKLPFSWLEMIFYYVSGVKQEPKNKTKRVKSRPMEIRPLIPRNPHFLREANYKKWISQPSHRKHTKAQHEPLLIPPSSSSSFRRFGGLFTNKYQINRQLPSTSTSSHDAYQVSVSDREWLVIQQESGLYLRSSESVRV